MFTYTVSSKKGGKGYFIILPTYGERLLLFNSLILLSSTESVRCEEM